MQIKYNPSYIREKATECLTLSDDISFTKDTVYSEIENYSKGTVQGKIKELVEQTDTCAVSCKTLVSQTAKFMKNVADYLENQDKNIAIKVGAK